MGDIHIQPAESMLNLSNGRASPSLAGTKDP